MPDVKKPDTSPKKLLKVMLCASLCYYYGRILITGNEIIRIIFIISFSKEQVP